MLAKVLDSVMFREAWEKRLGVAGRGVGGMEGHGMYLAAKRHGSITSFSSNSVMRMKQIGFRCGMRKR